jgi:hypothetical protein
MGRADIRDSAVASQPRTACMVQHDAQTEQDGPSKGPAAHLLHG